MQQLNEIDGKKPRPLFDPGEDDVVQYVRESAADGSLSMQNDTEPQRFAQVRGALRPLRVSTLTPPSLFLEYLREKSLEVLYMAHPIDEYGMQQREDHLLPRTAGDHDELPETFAGNAEYGMPQLKEIDGKITSSKNPLCRSTSRDISKNWCRSALRGNFPAPSGGAFRPLVRTNQKNILPPLRAAALSRLMGPRHDDPCPVFVAPCDDPEGERDTPLRAVAG